MVQSWASGKFLTCFADNFVSQKTAETKSGTASYSAQKEIRVCCCEVKSAGGTYDAATEASTASTVYSVPAAANVDFSVNSR